MMKKLFSIALALILALGVATTAMAMGASGPDPTHVGFVLTSFTVSDAMLSPLTIMNWSGQSTSKTYGENQPIWFIAAYRQNKLVQGDDRNFISVGQSTVTRTTVFTSQNNCVDFSFSKAYMNFAKINGLEVIGGNVSSGANVTATSSKLEVEFKADFAGATDTAATLSDLKVAGADNTERTYYLQIMGFTRTNASTQGTVYAKSPIDLQSFGSGTNLGDSPIQPCTDKINIYDSANYIRYIVGKYTVNDAAISGTLIGKAPINAVVGDKVYVVYDAEGNELISFISSGTKFKGMAKSKDLGSGNWRFVPVMYNPTGGNTGKYTFAFTNDPAVDGTEAIKPSELKAIMDFFSFSFANEYPVLDKHFEAHAGYWMNQEAKFNVANAVIITPDPPIANVPKTGDAANSLGIALIAFAVSALLAVGFVTSRRVHN